MSPTVVLLAAFAASSPRALVIPYQVLSLQQSDADRLALALREEIGHHGWTAVESEVASQQIRAAGMCGEDAPCLATLGQRTGAQWVLAFSLGKVGRSVMVNTILVETASGQRRSGSSETLVTLPADMSNLAQQLAAPLFRDVPPPVALVPGPPPEAPPMVAAQVPSKVKPWAIGTLVGAGALAIGGGILTGVAATQFEALKADPNTNRAAADANQRSLNLAADITVSAAIAVAATSIILFIVDGAGHPAPAVEATEAAE